MVKKIDDKKKQEFSGFEDLMDEVIAEREREEFLKRRKDLERYNDTFELYNFLEQETNRLKKVNSFFSEKLPNMQKNAQSVQLLSVQRNKTERSKQEVIEKIKTHKSTFQINMQKLWKSSFGSGSK